MNQFEILEWRGFVHNFTPNAKFKLQSQMQTGYIGFDPTADSLHVGNLMQIMFLANFQNLGHRPIALVGGATGMVGDPSGKSQERNLLDFDTLLFNQKCIQAQLEKFLNFSDNIPNKAIVVNNYDWFQNYKLLDFLRDVGKHITISYMMSKESVQKRIETGISFTEFSYQLLQGYDFYYMATHFDCFFQMGGADQWGNMTTGIELIRRMCGKEAECITAPLLTKPDGTKFGKSESGNIWLDPQKTSPYKFYQFWLNTSDEELEKLLKVFTFYSKEEIESILQQHKEQPHLRLGQKKLAEFVTILVHSKEDLEKAVEASGILFGDGGIEAFQKFDWNELQEVFDGVPKTAIDKAKLLENWNIVNAMTEVGVYPSKSEARKAIQAGALKVNKQKITSIENTLTVSDLIMEKFILIQKGKKNFHLIVVE